MYGSSFAANNLWITNTGSSPALTMYGSTCAVNNTLLSNQSGIRTFQNATAMNNIIAF